MEETAGPSVSIKRREINTLEDDIPYDGTDTEDSKLGLLMTMICQIPIAATTLRLTQTIMTVIVRLK